MTGLPAILVNRLLTWSRVRLLILHFLVTCSLRVSLTQFGILMRMKLLLRAYFQIIQRFPLWIQKHQSDSFMKTIYTFLPDAFQVVDKSDTNTTETNHNQLEQDKNYPNATETPTIKRVTG